MKSYFPNISLPHVLLSFLFYLSLVRGTSIGLFYPAEEYLIGAINYTPLTIMNTILLLGITAYFFVTKDFSFIFKSLSKAFISFICFGIMLSLLFSVDLGQSSKYAIAMIVVVLPAVLYFNEYGVEGLIKAIVRFTIVMAVVNLAYLIVFPQYAIMTFPHEGRWKGMFSHKNGAGPFFAISFYLVLYSLSLRRPLDFAIKLVVILISLLFTVFAQSSTAFVVFFTMGITNILCYYLLGFKTLNERIGIALTSVSLLLLIFVFFGGYIEATFFEVTGKDSSLTGRTGIWSVILDLVSERPFIGYGPGMSERPEFMERIQTAVGWEAKGTHNSYLDLLINYGYATTILMLFFVVKSWSKFLLIECKNKMDRKITAVSASIIITSLVCGFTSSALLYSRDILWVYIVCGLLIIGHLYKTTRTSNRSLP